MSGGPVAAHQELKIVKRTGKGQESEAAEEGMIDLDHQDVIVAGQGFQTDETEAAQGLGGRGRGLLRGMIVVTEVVRVPGQIHTFAVAQGGETGVDLS